jgi:hypothetical protein
VSVEAPPAAGQPWCCGACGLLLGHLEPHELRVHPRWVRRVRYDNRTLRLTVTCKCGVPRSWRPAERLRRMLRCSG